MKALIDPYFGYCLIIWIFCGRRNSSIDRFNKGFEKLSVKKLSENSVTIHNKSIEVMNTKFLYRTILQLLEDKFWIYGYRDRTNGI